MSGCDLNCQPRYHNPGFLRPSSTTAQRMATQPTIDNGESEHERGRTRTKIPARGESDAPHDHEVLNRISEVPSSHGESLRRDDISEHDFLSVRSSPARDKQPGARPPDEHHHTNHSMADPTALPRHPGQNKHRKLVLCFDGTGNKFHGDDSDSNILKIFRMLDRTACDQCE